MTDTSSYSNLPFIGNEKERLRIVDILDKIGNEKDRLRKQAKGKLREKVERWEKI